MASSAPTNASRSPEKQRLLEVADRIHRFPAKMTCHLASRFFADWGTRKCNEPGLFFDPFAGSGTTGLVALERGYHVQMGEIHPANAVIASAKLALLPSEGRTRLRLLARKRMRIANGRPRAPSQLWSAWWHGPAFAALERIRDDIRALAPQNLQPHLLTALSQASWDCSGADKNALVPTHSPRSPSNPPYFSGDVIGFFQRRLARIADAQDALSQLTSDDLRADVREADALCAQTWPSSVQVMLTSPPYGVGVDYYRAASLQARLLAEPDHLRKVRQSTIGRVSKQTADDDWIPAEHRRREWFKAMAASADGRADSFARYVSQMRMFFETATQRLSSDGTLGMVIGNPMSRGHRIPLVDIMIDVMEQTGLRLQEEPVADPIRRRIQAGGRRNAGSPMPCEFLVVAKHA